MINIKIRIGFVSNSSSASFVLYKDAFSSEILDAIRNHFQYAKDHGYEMSDESENEWSITELDHFMFGDTIMDNFDMQQFFETLKISRDKITYRSYVPSEQSLTLAKLDQYASLISRMNKIAINYTINPEEKKKIDQLQDEAKKYFSKYPIIFEDAYY